ncbi:unnamed protein product [Cylindrotheca closterium]|uniref:Borealin N-terminal domain-containing protein n=1 Tax=Cylindrotheca closterium TaxID=2856 RepID=A0AAD2G211_9STRA|nr:unnamed protein product [Cylindrotheca closterium]
MSSTLYQRSYLPNSGRQVLGNVNENDSSSFDGSKIDQVNALLEDLDGKFDNICSVLKAELNQHKCQQEEILSTELVKLPRSIKQMTVKDFNESHGCDLLAILKSKDGVIPSSNTNLIPMKRAFNSVMSTPSIRPSNPALQGSVLRTVRKGEGIYSQNGSPLESFEKGSVIATVSKKRRGNESESASFEISVGDGKFISLTDPSGVQGLDSNMKATAATQLKVLQDQMASLMAQLTD